MPSIKTLLEKFNKAKTLPHVAIRLTKLIGDEKSTMKDFEEVIKLDPTLVVRLLRAVNSPFYGLQQKVESIDRAVVFLGMANLRNMVVTEALKDIFKNGAHENIFSRRQLWLHSAAVSICCKMIAERVFEQNGEDAFLCGILHDIGMIIEVQVEEDLFLQVCRAFQSGTGPFVKYEREIIGAEHCAIGNLLALEWGLPVEVREAVKIHHRMPNKADPQSISGILQIAEYIVSKMDYTAVPGMKGQLTETLSEHIRDKLDEYKTLTMDLPEEMKKAKDIYETSEN
ncbi:HDOD domain-containing protein [Thermodesulfobacteriota bacterium]